MTNITEFGLAQIGQVSIPVHNLEQAIEFYRDKLGMKHLFTVPKMAFFDCSGVRVMLSVPESAEFDHPSSIIYFKVADIRETFKTLSQRGVRFRGEPHVIARMTGYDLWMAFFHDSENNILAIMSELARN